MMRARPLLAGGVAALAAGAAAMAGLLWMQPPPPTAAAALTSATAAITRGPLTDTRTVTGTLGYGELSALRPTLSDPSAMVTWIAPVGASVVRGQPLYALDGQPTILFYGSLPQHRTLRFDPDASFPVWVERERADSAFEAAELTLRLEQERLADAEARLADAAARLDDALSAAPQTAEFIQLSRAVRAAEARLGRVKALAAAQIAPDAEIAAAEVELDAVRADLDTAIRALHRDVSGARLDATTARLSLVEAGAQLSDLRTARDVLAARTSDDADIRQIAENLSALGYEGALPDRLRAWQRDAGLPPTGIVGPDHLVVAPGPVHIAAHGARIGETLAGPSSDRGAILDYSGIDRRVTVPLGIGDQRLAAVGRTAMVTLPDSTRVDGVIAAVGSVVSGGTIEVTVTIADQAALGGLEVASVDVAFVSSGRDDVLSVPVAALLALPEGGFALEVVGDGQSRVVPVATGLFASGRVEVAGDDIAEGVLVGVPR